MALNRTHNIDCYWVGAVPKIKQAWRGFWEHLLVITRRPNLGTVCLVSGLGFRVYGSDTVEASRSSDMTLPNYLLVER